ncbi:hypothetical protein LMZ02_02390 [Paenibacillus macerans]|uniref:hypothetical protein n=1 Tax=Paenibacillus macerans TaxID=44252 RepID=UPI001F10A6B9|nr:hypothetical protein [Paenibacillus macerans]UMV48278.1 hypothetical protein LMZ02_02390 [Paenibacillus macerans]
MKKDGLVDQVQKCSLFTSNWPAYAIQMQKCISFEPSDKKVAFDRNCTALLHFATHLSLLSSESTPIRRFSLLFFASRFHTGPFMAFEKRQ